MQTALHFLSGGTQTFRTKLSVRLVKRLDREMAFTSLKLKTASGAHRIKNADDAYSFMMHMRLTDQNKPHWQVARQALNNAGASDD